VLLNICHRALFQYARPVALRPHRIMTCPRGRYGLKLKKALLSTTPPASVEWTQDVFGNLIATAEFAASSEMLVIDSRTVVEQAATNWPVFSIAPSARTYPFQYGAEELLNLGALLLPVADPGSGLVREWARSFLMGRHPDTLTLSKATNEGVHREIRCPPARRTRHPERDRDVDGAERIVPGSCHAVHRVDASSWHRGQDRLVICL